MIRKWVYYLLPLFIIRLLLKDSFCNYPIWSKDGEFYDGIELADGIIIIKKVN